MCGSDHGDQTLRTILPALSPSLEHAVQEVEKKTSFFFFCSEGFEG